MQVGVEISRAIENKRIFVIEEDEIIRSALQFMLHDENETHELWNLDQAYRKSDQWKPDLILLGASIARRSGAGVVKDIAARMAGAKVLIVADVGDDAVIQACMKSGAHGVVTRPITIESVRLKVDVALGRRKLPMIPLGALV